MRWRVILGVSLVANLLLAIAWLRTAPPEAATDPTSGAITNSAVTNNRPMVVVRRQFFSWQELESQDYPTYIKNLREIGCPEQTIRDLIIADVTEMLRQKYQSTTTPTKSNPKWWTNRRDPGDQETEAENISRMWAERNEILNQLLGPDWAVRQRGLAVTPDSARRELILATLAVNPVLHALPEDRKLLVAEVLSAALGPNGGPENYAWTPAAVVAAEKERWARLESQLTPEQLEAAKLHFSEHAENWRSDLDALPGFDVQPEEFRRLYRNTEAIDAQLALLATRDDEAAVKERTALIALRETAIRNALPPERYELYVRLNDPAYLDALAELGGQNGSPEILQLLYAINRERALEEARIANDPTLTDLQREIALKQIELDLLKAAASALGEAGPDETAAAEKPRPEPMKTHRVAGGEGLERIARIYGVPPETLRAANPNLNFDQLPTGANVNIPLRLIYPLPPPPLPQ
jgi:LysM repeat protein